MLKLLQWYMFHPISKDRNPSSGIGMQQKLVLFLFLLPFGMYRKWIFLNLFDGQLGNFEFRNSLKQL